MDSGISTVLGRTLGERITHARSVKGIKSPAALARLIEERGYPITRQSMANIEADRVENPRPELLEHVAAVVGLTVEELRYGPRAEDTLFLAEMRGLEGDLTSGQRDQLLYLANEMAKETRAAREAEAKRRAEEALSEEEREWLAAFRAAAPAQRRDALAIALAEREPDQSLPTTRPATRSRRPRRSA